MLMMVLLLNAMPLTAGIVQNADGVIKYCMLAFTVFS